jgi:hypothetical protein
MNAGKHKEGNSTCLEIKKGNSTIRLKSKSSDTAVFRTTAKFISDDMQESLSNLQ